LNLSLESIFEDSAAAAQLESVGFRQTEPGLMLPVVQTEDLADLALNGPESNSDDRSYCQFMARRLPVDPQATIPGDMALILSLSGSRHIPSLYLGQMAYWERSLPEAVELLREACGSAMGRRWLALALTTVAEELWYQGRGAEALPLLEEAMTVDPGWDRPVVLSSMIENG
jgi:hypothetical protein